MTALRFAYVCMAVALAFLLLAPQSMHVLADEHEPTPTPTEEPTPSPTPTDAGLTGVRVEELSGQALEVFGYVIAASVFTGAFVAFLCGLVVMQGLKR